MKKILSCGLLAFLGALGAAGAVYAQQGSVNGFVRDATNGEPLAWANVYLDGTGLGAGTNERGYYYIGHVPPGEYELVASFVGYRNVTRRIRVEPNRTVTANFELEPAPLELGEVKVTAERARFEREVEVSATRLDTRQLILAPKVGGESDILRTIQMLPGVITVSDFSNKLYIRGGSPDQNLVLLDGITVYNPAHLFGMFSPFVAEAVADVTLLAGGFPASYGGRLSSVLDVSTREGNSKRHTGEGSVSLIAARGIAEGPIPRGSYLVAGRRTYLPDILVKAFNIEGLGYYFYDLMGKVNYAPREGSRLTFTGLAAEDVLDFWDPDNPNSFKARMSWGNRGISGRWNSIFTPLLYGEELGAWSSFFSKFRVNFGGTEDALMTTELTDITLKSDLTWFLADRHTLDLGLDAKASFMGLSFSFDTFSFTGRDTLWPIALYGDEKWEVVPERLFIRPGLRLAFYSKGSRFEAEPRLGIKFHPDRNTALNLALGRFTQPLVTLNSTDPVFAIYDLWVPVPRERRIPSAFHYIAGVERWLKRDAIFQLEFYYKDYNNLLETRYGQFFTRPDSLLVADGYSYGADLLVRKAEGRVNGWLSYSFMWTVRSIGQEVYHPHYDRRHTVNLVVNFPRLFWGVDLNVKWTLGSGLPYAGVIGYYRRFRYDPGTGTVKWRWEFIEGTRDAYRYPVYHRMDAGLSRSWELGWGKLTLFLDVTNLYNAKNVLLYYWDVDPEQNSLPERHRVSMLPILPTLGVSVRF
ncbi:MAG: TonB-dependent receptor [candidate division WOR-3 bacterium]